MATRFTAGWGLAFAGLVLFSSCAPQSSIPQGVQVYFSPNGGATQAAVIPVRPREMEQDVNAPSFPAGSAAPNENCRGADAWFAF